jgi:transcriptional regulator with XRE-family HTH domain
MGQRAPAFLYQSLRSASPKKVRRLYLYVSLYKLPHRCNNCTRVVEYLEVHCRSQEVSIKPMDIGQRIRAVREDVGMQATVLARRTGVAPNTIYRIETGERTPSMALLERIAHELHTEPAELLREPVPLADASETGRHISLEVTSQAGVTDDVKMRLRMGLWGAIRDAESRKASRAEIKQVLEDTTREYAST